MNIDTLNKANRTRWVRVPPTPLSPYVATTYDKSTVKKEPKDITGPVTNCDDIDGIISEACDYVIYDNKVNENWRERIVACVNFCINISTDDILKGKVEIKHK